MSPPSQLPSSQFKKQKLSKNKPASEPRHPKAQASTSTSVGTNTNAPRVVDSVVNPPQQATPLITYDENDKEIPRNNPMWAVRPHTHPWVKKGKAYICTYGSCYTIVRRRQQVTHDAVVHQFRH